MSWYKETSFLPGPSFPFQAFYFRAILSPWFTENPGYIIYGYAQGSIQEKKVQSEAQRSHPWKPIHCCCGCKVDPGLSEQMKASQVRELMWPATLSRRCRVLLLRHHALGPASDTAYYDYHLKVASKHRWLFKGPQLSRRINS